MLRDPKKLEKFKDNFQRVAAMADEIPVYSHEEILGRFKIRKI